MKLVRGNHCIYQIAYHQVLVVKYRKKLLKQTQHVDILKESIQEVCERYNYVIDEIGTDGDYVHLFVGAGGAVAPSTIMGTIKSLTAKRMLRLPVVKKELRGGSFRSSGGYIGTVGDGTSEEIVKRYIKNQGMGDSYYERLDFHLL